MLELEGEARGKLYEIQKAKEITEALVNKTDCDPEEAVLKRSQVKIIHLEIVQSAFGPAIGGPFGTGI